MDLGIIVISGESLFLAMSTILILALAIALVASKRRTGSVLTPVTLFFLFAVVHAIFGRYTAFLTAQYTFVGSSTLEPFINQSFLIISTGLTCCLLTYALLRFSRPPRVTATLAAISCKTALNQVCARSRVLILIAIPLIVIGLERLGGIPLFGDNVRQDRYLMNFLPEHRFDTFLVNRGRELIVIPAGALVLGWFYRRRSMLDASFIASAVISCLLTATRAPILIGVLIVLVLMVWRRKVNAVCFTVVAVVLALVASEIALGDLIPSPAESRTLERLGADLGEVRDLGWILLKQQDQYLGMTFLAGVLPIPAFASDFTGTYNLRTVTLSAIGFPLTAAHGGLRITYIGEWYLNFGWAGVVFGGVLYGWMCSRFSQLFQVLWVRSQKHPVGAYMLACAWVAFSFMIYLSGSATGGTIKTYAVVLVVLFLGLRRSRGPGGSRQWASRYR